jgi:hypothetical protein
MSRGRIDLDRIAVASPCPVAWDDMTGNDRVRFCSQCKLNVYNISAMTRSEAESFIANDEQALNLDITLKAGEEPICILKVDTKPLKKLRRKGRPRE